MADATNSSIDNTVTSGGHNNTCSSDICNFWNKIISGEDPTLIAIVACCFAAILILTLTISCIIKRMYGARKKDKKAPSRVDDEDNNPFVTNMILSESQEIVRQSSRTRRRKAEYEETLSMASSPGINQVFGRFPNCLIFGCP